VLDLQVAVPCDALRDMDWSWAGPPHRGITVETGRERATIAGDQALESAVLTLVAIIR
jgi:hypothetical protein